MFSALMRSRRWAVVRSQTVLFLFFSEWVSVAHSLTCFRCRIILINVGILKDIAYYTVRKPPQQCLCSIWWACVSTMRYKYSNACCYYYTTEQLYATISTKPDRPIDVERQDWLAMSLRLSTTVYSAGWVFHSPRNAHTRAAVSSRQCLSCALELSCALLGGVRRCCPTAYCLV